MSAPNPTANRDVDVVAPRPGERVAIDGGQFLVGDRSACTIVLEQGQQSADWWTRQNASVDSYRTVHEHIEDEKAPVYKLFGDYINAAAFKTRKPAPLLLDVGCGIFSRRSPAFSQLDERVTYVGLDPLKENLRRSYSFVCGRLEDIADLPGFTPRFDVFVFGTSLDHIEDLATAARAVRKLAAPGAVLVCWNGLHDPDKLVSDNGALVFRRLLAYRNRPLAMAAFAAYGALRLPRLLRTMKQKRSLLEREVVNDEHYRWFTDANTNAYLSTFGEVIDRVTLPNTHHDFATVRIGAAS